MTMKIYAVIQRYYDTGAVNVQLRGTNYDTLPEPLHKRNRTHILRIDYFADEQEALNFLAQKGE